MFVGELATDRGLFTGLTLAALPITLPSDGQWINYWDETQLWNGGTSINYAVPLGKEPILIRNSW